MGRLQRRTTLKELEPKAGAQRKTARRPNALACTGTRRRFFSMHTVITQQTDMLTAQQQERREFVLRLLSSYALLATHACRVNLSPVELRLSLLQALLTANFCVCRVCFQSARLK